VLSVAKKMNDTFVLLESFQYSSEALIYKGKLESEGIEVFMRDSNIVDSNPHYSNAVGGVKLFVRSEDVDKAKAILSQVSKFSLDENNQFIKCPKCNAEQVDMMTSINDVKSLLSFVFSLLFVLMPFHVRYKYKCSNCKHEFN
jgi:DNA-directed RNA polymerase subunit RPC12/RpoP